jgi:hypothetical protein
MSLRPQAEAPDLDSALDNAFQIRCTIQAARAAHAQFELAHGHEHECVDTGVKWGKAPVRGQPNKASRGVGKKGGTPKPSVKDRLGPRTPSVKDRLGKREAQNDYVADARTSPPASYGAPGSTADQTPTQPTPKVRGRVEGYTAALETILPGMLRNTDKQLPFVLVDGRNAFFAQDGKTKEKLTDEWEKLIGETARCLPASRGQVIVIWTKTAWDNQGCDNPEQRKIYANWLKPLAAFDTKVIFLLLEYDKKKTNEQRVKKCFGNWVDNPPSGRSNCAQKNESQCVLPGMDEGDRSHLACELDDVLLSALHCRLINANRVVQVVSLDKSILKNPVDVNKVVGWLSSEEAVRKFERAVWTYNVELTWP